MLVPPTLLLSMLSRDAGDWVTAWDAGPAASLAWDPAPAASLASSLALTILEETRLRTSCLARSLAFIWDRGQGQAGQGLPTETGYL